MKKPIFIKNAPINEKRIFFIETILLRLIRRSRKVATAIIPPIPLNFCVLGEDIQGCILNTLMFEGTITKALISIGPKVKSKVLVDVEIMKDGLGQQKTFTLNGVQDIVDLNINTQDGSILSVNINNDAEDKITKVLMSLLWIPSKKDVEIKNFLIEDLEKVGEELLKEE